MFKPGTIGHSLWRGAMVFVIMGVTTALSGNPEWGTITVGSLLITLVHFLEKKVTA